MNPSQKELYWWTKKWKEEQLKLELTKAILGHKSRQTNTDNTLFKCHISKERRTHYFILAVPDTFASDLFYSKIFGEQRWEWAAAVVAMKSFNLWKKSEIICLKTSQSMKRNFLSISLSSDENLKSGGCLVRLIPRWDDWFDVWLCWLRNNSQQWINFTVTVLVVTVFQK